MFIICNQFLGKRPFILSYLDLLYPLVHIGLHTTTIVNDMFVCSAETLYMCLHFKLSTSCYLSKRWLICGRRTYMRYTYSKTFIFVTMQIRGIS